MDAIPNVRGIVRFDVGSDYANSSVLTTMSDEGLKESLEVHTASQWKEWCGCHNMKQLINVLFSL